MSDMIRQLRPYQRIPESWVCAYCGSPAVGWTGARGVAVFYCAEGRHRDSAYDFHLESRMLLGAAGYSRLRMTWGYWLRSFYWRTVNALSVQRRRRNRKTAALWREIKRSAPPPVATLPPMQADTP